MVRLVLVDDQPVIRLGLRKRLNLEPDMAVIGEASNGREATALVEHLTPDVIVMDVEMPELDGISATAMIKQNTPESIVVLLSIHDNVSVRSRAKAAGAAAFVHKSGEIEDLIAIIRDAAKQKNL